MLRSSGLLSAAVLVSCAGCAEPPVEHTVRKVTAEDVRRDTEKAADTATTADARGLLTLRGEAGDRFVRGLVLYTGEHWLSLGDKIEAAPIASLWA